MATGTINPHNSVDYKFYINSIGASQAIEQICNHCDSVAITTSTDNTAWCNVYIQRDKNMMGLMAMGMQYYHRSTTTDASWHNRIYGWYGYTIPTYNTTTNAWSNSSFTLLSARADSDNNISAWTIKNPEKFVAALSLNGTIKINTSLSTAADVRNDFTSQIDEKFGSTIGTYFLGYYNTTGLSAMGITMSGGYAYLINAGATRKKLIFVSVGGSKQYSMIRTTDGPTWNNALYLDYEGQSV